LGRRPDRGIDTTPFIEGVRGEGSLEEKTSMKMEASKKTQNTGSLAFHALKRKQRSRFQGVGKGPIRYASHLASVCKVALLVLPEPSWISAA
jgi:hypothetical protein